jgi:hypothetical protein
VPRVVVGAWDEDVTGQSPIRLGTGTLKAGSTPPALLAPSECLRHRSIAILAVRTVSSRFERGVLSARRPHLTDNLPQRRQ